jgi:hypothetical protein
MSLSLQEKKSLIKTMAMLTAFGCILAVLAYSLS